MDKDICIILEETLKLCDSLLKDDKYFMPAYALSKAILAYQLKNKNV